MQAWRRMASLLLGASLLLAAAPAGAAGKELLNLDLGKAAPAQTSMKVDRTQGPRGGDCLRVTAPGPVSLCLAQLDQPQVEACQLWAQAMVSARDLQGQAYLEIWVHMPGPGFFFSKGLQQAVKGGRDWQATGAPFMLQKGQRPQKVTVNLTILGRGTVLIDDLRLVQRPLP